MANVLTSLAADIYAARDIVGRELVGIIPACMINADGSIRAAKGDTVRAAYTRAVTVSTTYAPAMTIPEGTDQTIDNKTMSLSTFANVQIPWTGEDIKHMENGYGFADARSMQILQAMRAIVNKMELDLGAALDLGAGMGYGTAATTPFASNLNDLSNVRRLLVDRGCPDDGQLSAVYNTAAGVNLRNLANLYKVNEAGSADLLRNGVLLDLYGMKIRESAQIPSHTAGSGASYLLNGALAIGDTSVTVDTGSGTILAGDVVTIGNFKYVVATALAANVFTLNSPMREAAADNLAITVAATQTANFAFHKQAVELAMRPIALPMGGDLAVDRMTVQDNFSGLIFEIAVYKGYQKMMLEVSALYGVKVWKPDFVVKHMG